jgi:hypothetical protein
VHTCIFCIFVTPFHVSHAYHGHTHTLSHVQYAQWHVPSLCDCGSEFIFSDTVMQATWRDMLTLSSTPSHVHPQPIICTFNKSGWGGGPLAVHTYRESLYAGHLCKPYY